VGYARRGWRLRGMCVLLWSRRGMNTLGGGVGWVTEGSTWPSSWSGGIRCSGMRWPFPSSTRTSTGCDGCGCSAVFDETCVRAAAVGISRCTRSHRSKASWDRFTCPRPGGGRAGPIAGVGVASLSDSTDSGAALRKDLTHMFNVVSSV
jgi:hypothetical protein